eukprot:14080103-Ditylum_brightwellii.AAC.1
MFLVVLHCIEERGDIYGQRVGYPILHIALSDMHLATLRTPSVIFLLLSGRTSSNIQCFLVLLGCWACSSKIHMIDALAHSEMAVCADAFSIMGALITWQIW